MTVYLSLGANLGQREQTLSEALRLLAPYGEVQAVSEYYYSEPWGFTSPHGFCNICARFQTDLSPEALLQVTQHIERTLGRTHKTPTSPTSPTSSSSAATSIGLANSSIGPADSSSSSAATSIGPADSSSAPAPHQPSLPSYSDRPIDIDLILAFAHNSSFIIHNSPTLTLPHPLWRERDFVLIPLRQVLLPAHRL